MTDAPVTHTAWTEALRQDRPRFGMWIASGDTYTAEICAGAGLDWLLLDLEHAPNDIRSTLAQLQATAAYPVHVVVRAPDGDPVMIKRLLDIGVTDLMVPMVDTAEEAAALVAATRYPPAGIRGVGSALSRASRWNRTPGYLTVADTTVSLTVQVESTAGLAELPAITRTDGVDAVFIGPADLAASMGHLGRPEHPDVVATIARSIGIIKDAGAFAGVNAFNPDLVETYTAAGADFVLVGADVAILARGSEALATRYITDSTHPTLDSGAH